MKVIFIEKENLAAAWEKGVRECWYEGADFSTQYDRPGDPPSKDCTMLLHITNPFAEPRYHLGIPGGLEDVEKYVQEVIYGVHDHWMDDQTNPNRWTYTYHQRLFGYGHSSHKPISTRLVGTKAVPITYVPEINQIKVCVQQLKECGHTRRSQAITWQPWFDADHNDPPCLQSLWFRVENGKLNMNVRFRSNDLLKAAFMNMIALTELQKLVATEVGVGVGEYVHLSDSMHIYGKDFAETERFFSLCNKRKFEERVKTTHEVAGSFVEGCRQLLTEENMPEEKKVLITARMKFWEVMDGQ